MISRIVQETARKYALQNAIQFDGKADINAVIRKVVAVIKKDDVAPQDLIPVVKSIVNDVNRIPLKEQIAELEVLAPELLEKEKQERDFTLPDLPNAKKGKVVTRFPPEPNGFLHIGHVKAAVVDHDYARMYKGRFILRFDDTNPKNARLEFYAAQKEDLQWLDITWDEEYNTSDHLEHHYKLVEQLIRQENAYICLCPPDIIKTRRFRMEECSCRDTLYEDNIDLWNEMLYSSTIDRAIVRLKGDMGSPNTAMRDPTLFRIIDAEHPIQGKKYRVWPTYDFAGPIEDSLSGVTHPFRTKEYELRDECYYHILTLLKMRKPCLMEFARLSIEGMPVSKRKIKSLIDQKLIQGYDDIRLPTLRGLQKRGILPEAIKQFVLSQGISKVESKVPFSLLEATNRKLLDQKTKRYFFVPNPIKLIIHNAIEKEKKLSVHPTNKSLGFRTIKTGKTFFIPKNDIKNKNIGDIFRLKDLFNVKILEKNKEIFGEYVGEKLLPNTEKIQWCSDHFIKMKVYVPKPLFKHDRYNPKNIDQIKGVAEETISNLKTGEIIQFERFGFVKIEKKDNEIIGFFTHK